jgi:catechol 2,3-dioxygenase-like lactoylglutathione lyase family enzyme
MDFRLELVPVPVSDVDRSKTFYVEQVGFLLDHDHRPSDDRRVVQLTPPGSRCSIAIGVGFLGTSPGSVQGLHLVVADIRAARAELVGRGVTVDDINDLTSPGKPTVSYAGFADPDGNSWTLQQF